MQTYSVVEVDDVPGNVRGGFCVIGIVLLSDPSHLQIQEKEFGRSPNSSWPGAGRELRDAAVRSHCRQKRCFKAKTFKKPPPAARPQLPKIFPVNHHNGRNGSIKVIEQARIHADAARDFVPAAIRFKSRAVAEGAAAAIRTEMMCHQFALPAVDRITRGAGEVKLRWRIVRMQHAAL